MSNDKTKVWSSEITQQFAEVLADVDSVAEMKNFLRDVMTEKEIVEVSARLEAAKMLSDGKRYTEIVAKTNLSSRTVARISEWLKNGCSGYQTAVTILASRHGHISPARAD